ncbi:hypothetical protein MUK42_03128 [Musa troglodytarum]|uniref:non-specific serine/threonine protein kinase n=1 Tax=Musa troglodytarum TaxID=320322 RepID=A0A9E7I444_9LILI|nr:hypothetical protein MUK42_03128 [Musa troglodytarum]
MGNTCVGSTLGRHSFFQSVSAAVLWRPRSSSSTGASDESPSAAPAPDRPPEPVTISSDDLKSSGSTPPAAEYPPQSPPRHFNRLPSAGLRAGAVLPRKTDNLKDLYILGRKLGQGQFGTTHLCIEKATGKQFACKSIAKRKLATYEDVEDVRREIQIMHHLSGHPNVISIIGTFEDAVAVHLVMDLCAGGELFDRITQRGHFSEKAAAGLARVIVGVVEACHSMGVMHRDLKPENFLFVNRNEDSPLKTIDFGLSVFFKPGHPWVCVDGVAPDKPLDSAVLTRLKQFSAMNKLKKMAIRVIAESLSEEEIAGLKEMFKMIDADNSGQITYEELKVGLIKVGANLKESEISALMAAADIDNSGTIDYGEFIAATLHLNKIEREDNLFSAFSYFDKDGSGYITQDELQKACDEFGIEDVCIEEIIQEIDQDNDGRIDYNEFVTMMHKGNAAFGKKGQRNNYSFGLREALRLG